MVYTANPYVHTHTHVYMQERYTFEDDSSSVRFDPERGAPARGKPMSRPARLNKICPPPP